MGGVALTARPTSKEAPTATELAQFDSGRQPWRWQLGDELLRFLEGLTLAGYVFDGLADLCVGG